MSNRVVDMLRKDTHSNDSESPFEKIKRDLHGELVASLDLAVVQSMARPELEAQLRRTLTDMVTARALPVTRENQAEAIEDILDEVLGFGPLERLLRQTGITDILVNGANVVYVERNGILELTNVKFRDDAHLMHVIDRIVGAVGRRIDESTPMVDARLPDGSRFNAVIPPAALDGPMVSIRRFGINPIRREDLVRLGAIPEPLMQMLEACVRAKLNILVSGGTGSGKTTLLNVLSGFIPASERIVTVEDAAELQLQQHHVVRLETRPPNLEGLGEITPRALVRNALRMRPDRIIVGEIRGDESIDMLQAMNTGHDGSLTTTHANSPLEAISRLETLVLMAGVDLPVRAIREQIASSVHVIVQQSRLSDGSRKVTAISEVVGIDETGEIELRPIFEFVRTGTGPGGKVIGEHRATGYLPSYLLDFIVMNLVQKGEPYL